MDRLQFTYAGRDHDRTRALRDGTVRPDSIDLRFVDLRVSEIFWRMARYADFDVAEMSLSTFILTREKKTVDLVAIPIFPSRAFRHDMIFVNTKAGIERPEDLKGKRVGLPEYQMTAALWIRGLLQHEHGVASQDIHWVRGPHFAGHPAEERVPWIPPGIDLVSAPEGRGIDDLLEQGEIDALISAEAPLGFKRKTGAIRRLFPEARAAAEDYWRRTKIFPIMHTVVIRRDVYEANRWVALSLFKAFCQAKQLGYTAIREGTLRVSLPFLLDELEKQTEFFGPDPWAYGVEPARHVIETALEYSMEQGLSSKLWTIEELFAPETLHEDDPTTYYH